MWAGLRGLGLHGGEGVRQVARVEHAQGVVHRVLEPINGRRLLAPRSAGWLPTSHRPRRRGGQRARTRRRRRRARGRPLSPSPRPSRRRRFDRWWVGPWD